MPCFHCHVAIKLPAAHSAFMLGTKKTWPNKVKRRLGIPVESRAQANRRAAVRAGNAQPETWGKRRPDTVEAWQAWAFKSEQYQWARKQSVACWSKHPDIKKQIALLDYYRNHETRKSEMAARSRKRYHQYKYTPEFRMRHVMRNVIARIARKTKSKKSRRTNEYLGCTFQEARAWIEKQFKRGMLWDNHGEWEIHHKIPLAEWDLTDPQQMVRATHFTNLQPLWRHENRSIGARLVGQHQMALL
jgi:hypothetical protein